MEFSALSDPYLKIAFWTGVGALALTVAMIFQILYLRFKLVRYQRRETAFHAAWRPLLLAATTNELPAALPSLARRDQLFFLKLWNHLQESVRGDATSGLNAVAYRMGTDIAARQLLARRNRAEKLLGILTLGHLRDKNAWKILAAEANAEDAATSINALRALVQIDAIKAADELTPLLLRRDDWALARVAGLLQESKSAFAAPLTAAIENQPANLERTLRLIEALRMMLPAETVRMLLAPGKTADVTIAALRVTFVPQLVEDVRLHLPHPDWRVRVQTAKVLGRIGDRTDVARLASMLGDHEWWVRYRAAQALIALPFFSRSEFDALHSSTLDRFARDMLEQVLAEKAQ